jgi:hypothetical protein
MRKTSRHALALVASMALVLAGASALPAWADDTPADAMEELRIATARLQYALEKCDRIGYPVGGTDRRLRADILDRGRVLMKQAATVSRDNEEGIAALLQELAGVRQEALDFVERVVPIWQEPSKRPEAGLYRSAYAEVVKFHDVVEDVRQVLGTVSVAEGARVDELEQQGEDTVAAIKVVRERDHEQRAELVRKLMAIRSELQDIHDGALTDRTKGFAFVPLRRSGQLWTDVSYTENGFSALRTRFIEPGSAYVTVRNDGDEMRPAFVEIEFYDATGDRTGGGTYETAELEELRPGEVREVLVPIAPERAGFWDATRGYSLALN